MQKQNIGNGREASFDRSTDAAALQLHMHMHALYSMMQSLKKLLFSVPGNPMHGLTIRSDRALLGQGALSRQSLLASC
jgi:hypothetical protein